MDVEAIDLVRLDADDRPGERAAGDLIVEPVALERRDRLRVTDPGDVTFGIENDRAGHDRTSKTTAADLVAAGHIDEPHPPQRVLERPKRADLHHRVSAIRRTGLRGLLLRGLFHSRGLSLQVAQEV